MNSNEYASTAAFIQSVVEILDNFLDKETSAGSCYKPTNKSRELTSRIILQWSKAVAKDIKQYGTPEKAEKVAALLKALAELIK